MMHTKHNNTAAEGRSINKIFPPLTPTDLTSATIIPHDIAPMLVPIFAALAGSGGFRYTSDRDQFSANYETAALLGILPQP